jgi:UDP:flavonoid glycosyltransferase YjiC (YdhE family)
MQRMRILLTTRGSAGHVMPLAPFGLAAQRAGHEVLVVAQGRHEANVARTGLAFTLTDDPDPAIFGSLQARLARMGIEAANDAMVAEYFARYDTEAMLPALRETAETWSPDIIVREAWEYGSTIVADLYDIPIVRVGLGLACLEERSIALAAPAVDEARADAGLSPDPGGERMRATPLYTMMPAVLEIPGSAPASIRRFRQAEPVLTPRDSAPLPDWWPGNADPLVYLSLGSVAGKPHMSYFPALYRRAIDALATLPIRLLVTLGDAPDPGALGALPRNVHVARWVPQEAVLPHASVAVSHGGYGSTLGALAHGVPLVVLPLFSSDQWINAEAVQRVGAGIALGADHASRAVLDLPDTRTLDGLAPAVAELLIGSAARGRAGEIAAAMAALPPVEGAIAELAAIRDAPRPWRRAAAW